jgi:hypothetical protein
MPRIRLPRHLAACLGAMLFISCSDPMGMCACPPASFRALLKGRVTDPAGQPVQGARLVAEVAEPGCTGFVHPSETRTGPDGTYRLTLIDFRDARPGDCLRAYATPPAGSALAGSDTVPFAVRFGVDQVVDSAQVNLVLRAP